MTLAMVDAPDGIPAGNLYDPAVVKMQRMGVEAARKNLARLIQAAKDEGIHTDIAKYGSRDEGAVLVPKEWYRRMRELSGEPTDI